MHILQIHLAVQVLQPSTVVQVQVQIFVPPQPVIVVQVKPYVHKTTGSSTVLT